MHRLGEVLTHTCNISIITTILTTTKKSFYKHVDILNYQEIPRIFKVWIFNKYFSTFLFKKKNFDRHQGLTTGATASARSVVECSRSIQEIRVRIKTATDLCRKKQLATVPLLNARQQVRMSQVLRMTSWLIDYKVFFAVSEIFRPCNGGGWDNKKRGPVGVTW